MSYTLIFFILTGFNFKEVLNYYNQGQYEKVIENLLPFCQKKGDEKAYYLLSLSYLRIRDYSNAIFWGKKFAEKFKKSEYLDDINTILAESYVGIGQKDSAFEYFLSVLKESEDSALKKFVLKRISIFFPEFDGKVFQIIFKHDLWQRFEPTYKILFVTQLNEWQTEEFFNGVKYGLGEDFSLDFEVINLDSLDISNLKYDTLSFCVVIIRRKDLKRVIYGAEEYCFPLYFPLVFDFSSNFSRWVYAPGFSLYESLKKARYVLKNSNFRKILMVLPRNKKGRFSYSYLRRNLGDFSIDTVWFCPDSFNFKSKVEYIEKNFGKYEVILIVNNVNFLKQLKVRFIKLPIIYIAEWDKEDYEKLMEAVLDKVLIIGIKPELFLSLKYPNYSEFIDKYRKEKGEIGSPYPIIGYDIGRLLRTIFWRGKLSALEVDYNLRNMDIFYTFQGPVILSKKSKLIGYYIQNEEGYFEEIKREVIRKWLMSKGKRKIGG